MSITKEQIVRIEKLAQLKMSESKVEEITLGLSKVFDWIDQLKKVDISDTQPLANPVVDIIPQTPLREDVPHLENSKEDVLSNAPEQDYGFFLVPKVVE
jgi:aspartyl-tRNA(Asn)/glutamyl-tRNA(Gln) amidotransferase subunit C